MISAKYVNRDLSWLEFNRRVLEEAQDPETPLLERVKFLSIVSSNLDEFMSVRVAGIHDQLRLGYHKKDFTGYTPSGLLKRLMKRTSKAVTDQYRTYRELIRSLHKEGLVFTTFDDLNSTQQKAMQIYFDEIVFPVLTPMAVDQSRPFPLVHTNELYLAVVLQRRVQGPDKLQEPEQEPFFSVVQVPSILPRYIHVPNRTNSKKQEFILLEDLIKVHIEILFSGYIPVAVHGFRMTRNADLTLDEEGAEDLLEEIEKELRRRRWGVPVRLEIESGMHPYALQLLQEEFEIMEHVFTIDGPIDLSFLMKFAMSLQNADHLRYPKLDPVYPEELADADDLFSVLRVKDVLMYHPYESFDVVNDFICQAADDPDVLAIKMTLYRVSGNSILVQALARAAESGKQVTVVVELKARFDEERNIAWARQLEKAGCHVVYGLVGLKTHAKITLVVRREQSMLRRYVHVGTGNYNENTAKLYTDVGLFTSNSVIGEDASLLFNEVTGYSAPHDWQAFVVAPTELKDKLISKIKREMKWASEGKEAHIIAQINSLSNQEMIDQLYAASQMGVRIDLIVRGVCCLRPGVPGLSENIRVISIVDRFLEHSRIIYFKNGEDEEVYLSSADWMTRNLTRRIELMCPVFDKALRKSLIRMLDLKLRDNSKARELQLNGTYTRVRQENQACRSQFEAMHIEAWKSVPVRV
ncbi:polyphosphate kinase 1 [Paenibacillus terrigena]|uniref:polyphosphate kinase 1 n=1 Tax=Paenibacillus terrigena TaxID=369333 RepID=UPI00035F665E|nr:polyphosphate kinase 1 [Paenibacillus terrigena]